MAVYLVTESDGWDGLARSLANARDGDTIEIGAGRFKGDQTLSIPEGVTLAGADGHALVYTGKTVAIMVAAAARVTLEHINLQGYQGLEHADEGDPDEEFTVGLIQVVDSSDILIHSATILAGARRRSCISIIGSKQCDVTGCSLEGARRGIALWSSVQATLSDNDVRCCYNAIVLARDPRSPGAASQAVIRGNRCHENKQAGILLFSSGSDAIADNDCWGNDTGIVLSRDRRSPGAASQAVIRGNRCHENRQAGILLFSSDSGAIADNDCWGNGDAGIVLRRDSECPGAASQAVIRGNRCHENKEAGIRLFSSDSDAIADNDRWGNGNAGIVLQRDPQSPGAASQAVIRGNRCQANRGDAIFFRGSTGSAIGNFSFANGIDGPEYEPSHQLQLSERPPLFDGNRRDPGMDLPGRYFPSLRKALTNAASPSNRDPGLSAEGLCAYLTTGCPDCFHHFWTGHRRSGEVADLEDLIRYLPGKWSVARSAEGKLAVSRQTGRKGPLLDDLTSLIARLREAAARKTGDRHWFVLVTPDETDPEQVAASLAGTAEQDRTGFRPGLRLAPPVMVGMGSGSPGFRSGLVSALMEGRNIWRERLAVLWQETWLKALVAIGLLIAGAYALDLFPSAFSAILDGAWRAAAWTGLAAEGRLNWATLLWILAVLAGFAIFMGSALIMPRHLRLGAGRNPFDQVVSTAADDAVQGIAVNKTLRSLTLWLLDKISPKFLTRRSDLADTRWIRRRLFAQGELAVLILRETAEMRHEDVDWLERITAGPGDDRAVVVLVHLDDRSHVRPVLMDHAAAPWASGYHLYLNDSDEHIRIKRAEPRSMAEADAMLATLFGVSDPDRLRTTICEEGLAVRDLLPALPLASAPASRLFLERMVADERYQQGPLVSLHLPSASHFFEGRDLPGAAGKTDSLFAGARAKATEVRKLTIGRCDLQRVTGRLAGRRATGEVLATLWPEGTDWEEYVASALRFGVWLKVTALAERISSARPDLSRDHILRELDGLVFLGQDLAEVTRSGCPIHAEDRFVQAWNGLRSEMEGLAAAPGRGDLIARFLAAEHLCLRHPSDLGSRLAGVTAEFVATPDRLLQNAQTACDQFCMESALRVINLAQLDDMARSAKMVELNALQWKALPSAMIEAFKRMAGGTGAWSSSLQTMFAHATSEAEVEQIVRLHAAFPERVLFAISAAAVGWTLRENGWTFGEPTPDDDLAPIGRFLIRMRSRIIEMRGFGKDVRLNRMFAAGATGPRQGGELVARMVSRNDMIERMSNWLRRDPEDLLDDFEARLIRDELGTDTYS